MSNYVQSNDPGLFDLEDRLAELQTLGDPRQRLDAGVDWAIFEPVLAQLPQAQPKGPGGRPAFHPLRMFKALVLAHLYNRSDAPREFPITDRYSFQRFLGLRSADSAPDEKPLGAFREPLTRHGLLQPAVDAFGQARATAGLLARQGQMIDAPFVEVPRQRNTREENAPRKAGQPPADWAPEPAKARPKDVAARWAKKGAERHYGSKNPGKVASQSKRIEAFTVTDAAVHDSAALEALVAPGDPVTSGDSAYGGPRWEAVFARHAVEAKGIERPDRNRPLPARQQRCNQAKSRVRGRGEPGFGTIKMSLRARWHRCIGQGRKAAAITLPNLGYNLVRFEQIERLQLRTW